MTALEMKYRFNIKLREVLKALNHPFTTTEINRFFNEVQLSLVNALADQFEINEDMRKKLSPITKAYTAVPLTYMNRTNFFIIELPEDMLRVVEEWADGVRVKPITHDEYQANKDNPLRKPYAELYWRMDTDGKHEIITDGATIDEYNCIYLIVPPNIDIDNAVPCVLPESVQNDIINGAVALAEQIIVRQAQMLNPKTNK